MINMIINSILIIILIAGASSSIASFWVFLKKREFEAAVGILLGMGMMAIAIAWLR